MKAICITGIGGYLGLATAHALVSKGYKVVGIGSKPNRPESLPIRVEYAAIDIRESEALAAFFTEHNVGTVFHFAAIKYVGKCEAEPDLCFAINTEGTNSVLKAMTEAEVGHIVYASTYAVYDWSGDDVVLNKISPTDPLSVYGRSKLKSEQLILDYKEKGLIDKYHILRYANIVGAVPELTSHEPQSFLDKIIKAAKTGETITLNGDDYDTADGSVARDFIDIRDVVAVHELILNNDDSAIYNVSSGQAVTLRQLANMTENVSGNKISIQVNPRSGQEPSRIVIDHSQLTEAHSWSPRYSIEETIKLLYERIAS